TELCPLSLHDALPIFVLHGQVCFVVIRDKLKNSGIDRAAAHKREVAALIAEAGRAPLAQQHRFAAQKNQSSHFPFVSGRAVDARSEEHTAELQSPYDH